MALSKPKVDDLLKEKDGQGTSQRPGSAGRDHAATADPKFGVDPEYLRYSLNLFRELNGQRLKDGSSHSRSTLEMLAAFEKTLDRHQQGGGEFNAAAFEKDYVGELSNNLERRGLGNQSGLLEKMFGGCVSKDPLYNHLKDIHLILPQWLESNRSKLPKSETQRFLTQIGLVKQILEVYEREKPGDSENLKEKRKKKISELFQKLKDLGEPPLEVLVIKARMSAGPLTRSDMAPLGCNVQ